MSKLILGLILGLAIGAGCRFFDVPVPSPPKLAGALLVLSMTVGYVTADRLMRARPATTQEISGGPPGTPGQTHE